LCRSCKNTTISVEEEDEDLKLMGCPRCGDRYWASLTDERIYEELPRFTPIIKMRDSLYFWGRYYGHKYDEVMRLIGVTEGGDVDMTLIFPELTVHIKDYTYEEAYVLCKRWFSDNHDTDIYPSELAEILQMEYELCCAVLSELEADEMVNVGD
jgi:hypothetical protein